MQAFFSILGVVTTAQTRTPGLLTRWLYRRLTQESWHDVPAEVEMTPLVNRLDEVAQARVERRVMLKQLSASVGPCALIAAAMLLWRFGATRDGFDLAAGLAAVLVGVTLIPVGRVAAAQEAKYYERVSREQLAPRGIGA